MIRKPCVISDHSSGGILAAYVAGKIPDFINGLMLEDPPFYNVMPGEFENTFVYKDSFQVMHEFMNQTDEKEYIVYNLQHGYIYNYLGKKFLEKTGLIAWHKKPKKNLKRLRV